MDAILKQLGKDTLMYMSPDEFPLPWEYRGLHFEGLIGQPPPDVAERTIVFLDCGNIDRMPVDFLQVDGLHILNIDHHHDNTRFGTVNLVCSSASSTAEMVWRLAKELDAEITPEIAKALYVGLVTDTGRFMYENTTPVAHEMAAELIAAGVEPHTVYRELYEDLPFRRLQLLQRALASVERHDDGAITVAHLTKRRLRGDGRARDRLRGRGGPHARRGGHARGGARARAPRRRPRGDAEGVAAGHGRLGGRVADRARSSAAAATRRRRASRPRRRTVSWSTSCARRCASNCRRADRPDGRRAPSGEACGGDLARRGGGGAPLAARAKTKVGHAGTLDPFATGLLLVLVGRATRAQRFFMDLPKTYRAVARLGWTSTTGDRDGELVETGRMPESLSIPVGEQLQTPPAYSAVKVGGRRAYELARAGETPELQPRPVTVYRADLLWNEGDRAAFEIECSSGTYVRSLVTDLGDAYCEELERTAIGPFRLEDPAGRPPIRPPPSFRCARPSPSCRSGR